MIAMLETMQVAAGACAKICSQRMEDARQLMLDAVARAEEGRRQAPGLGPEGKQARGRIPSISSIAPTSNPASRRRKSALETLMIRMRSPSEVSDSTDVGDTENAAALEAMYDLLGQAISGSRQSFSSPTRNSR